MRQPFAGGGLSMQDKIQELLASIPGLMMADFVPVSEKVELKDCLINLMTEYA
jgi:hypothetical protein